MQSGKKSLPLEKTVQKRLINKLKKIPGLYYFCKEARSIVGIPDLIICYKGRFIAIEVKRCIWEIYNKDLSMKTSGRHLRQLLEMDKIRAAGGYATFAYPENEEEVYKWLQDIAAL